MDAHTEPTAATLAFDLRDTWQARVLAATHDHPLGAVMLSVLAHAYDAEPLVTTLMVVFPGFRSIAAPFICSAGKVDKIGRVVADVVMRDETVRRDQPFFSSLDDFKSALRWLADGLKLTDADRVEMFTLARRWVVADRRLDPTFDPQDPDARRLCH